MLREKRGEQKSISLGDDVIRIREARSSFDDYYFPKLVRLN